MSKPHPGASWTASRRALSVAWMLEAHPAGLGVIRPSCLSRGPAADAPVLAAVTTYVLPALEDRCPRPLESTSPRAREARSGPVRGSCPAAPSQAPLSADLVNRRVPRQSDRSPRPASQPWLGDVRRQRAPACTSRRRFPPSPPPLALTPARESSRPDRSSSHRPECNPPGFLHARRCSVICRERHAPDRHSRPASSSDPGPLHEVPSVHPAGVVVDSAVDLPHPLPGHPLRQRRTAQR